MLLLNSLGKTAQNVPTNLTSPLNINQTVFPFLGSKIPNYILYITDIRVCFCCFLTDTIFGLYLTRFSYSPYLTFWNASLKCTYSWLQSLWIWSRSLGHLILTESQLHEPIYSMILSAFASRKNYILIY